MIGDWVLITDTQNYKKKGISVMTEEGVLLSEPLKIYSLYPDTITVGTGQRAVAIVTGDMIEPIPLTPEILERNGFKKCTTYSFFNAMEVEEWNLTLGKSVFTVTTPDNPEIQLKEVLFRHPELEDFYFHIIYNKDLMVHELQHALRLCGIEKEIEL